MSTPLTDKQIDRLIADYLAGSLREAHRAVFEHWLRASPKNPRRVARLSVTDYCIHEVCQDTKADYLLDILNQIDDAAGPAQLVTLHHIGPSWRRYRLPVAIGGAIAAVLLIAVTLIIALPSNTSSELVTTPTSPSEPGRHGPAQADQPVVATLTATHEALWAEGALAPRSPLQAGTRLTLTAGFAEITTHDGAIAILEAPATVELLDNNNAIRLHTGKLVGICETDSSKGFLVRTPHMDVTDLGTRFGVGVDRVAGTFVEVLDGEVAVQPHSGSIPARTLIRAESIALDADGREVTHEHAVAASFSRLAGVGSGVVEMSDNIAFVPSVPDRLIESRYASDTHAYLFEEFSDLTLPADVRVSITKPGRYDAFLPEATGAHTISSGTAVRSYVIRAKSLGKLRAYHGRLTFDGPILGVMVLEDGWRSFNAVMPGRCVQLTDLIETNEILEGVDSPLTDGRAKTDWLTIHPDRATLEFSFYVTDRSDCVRVFVAAPNDEVSETIAY